MLLQTKAIIIYSYYNVEILDFILIFNAKNILNIVYRYSKRCSFYQKNLHFRYFFIK